MSNQDRSLDDIQSDIQRTRGRLDETLTSLENRLEPRRLMDQGIDYLRDNGAKEYFVNLGESAKHQPLPLALVGVGLAWLMLTDNRKRPQLGPVRWNGSNLAADQDSTLRNAKAKVSGAASEIGHKVEGARESVASTATDVRDRVTGAVADMRESISSSATDARDRMSRTAQQAGAAVSNRATAVLDSADQAATKVRRGAERVRSRYEQVVDDQPLALGAVGLAIGALLAASAPRTRQETRLMGDASDRLREDVTEFGREQAEQLKEVASSAMQTAKASESGKTQDKAESSSPAETSQTSHPADSKWTKESTSAAFAADVPSGPIPADTTSRSSSPSATSPLAGSDAKPSAGSSTAPASTSAASSLPKFPGQN